MKRIAVSQNFYLDEFVDPYTYFNTEDHGLSLLDHRLFDIAQLLRWHYGKPIFINTWWKYYQDHKDRFTLDYMIKKIENSTVLRKWSGLRTNRSNVGTRLSAHRFGKAIDPKGDEILFFNSIKENAKVFYDLGVRRLEDTRITKGWLHIDTQNRNTKKNSIRVVDTIRSTQTIYF